MSTSTLRFPRPKNEDRLPVRLHDLADERVRGRDLQPLGAPTELVTWRGVSLADQIDPERVFDRWRQSMRFDWQALLVRRLAHQRQRTAHPRSDDWVLYQSVRGDHVHGFCPLFGR